jgi:RNA polymerase sigma factor (sigma-70 family)
MAPADDTTSDAELLARCRDGEQAAWAQLVRRYQRLIYTVPRRAGLPEEQAADVFQVVFQRLFEHLHRIADPSRIQAWLVTTARRETLKLLDQARRRVDLAVPAQADDGDAPDPMERIADDAPLPEALLADLQQQHRLQLAVQRLDARTRAFVELVFLQDEPLPYSEVARRLGIAEGSIGPTRARCLEKLRIMLREF